MKRFAFLAAALLTFAGPALGQPAPAKHGKGYVPPTPAALAARHAAALKRHGDRVKSLPKVAAPSWDCTTLGFVLPVDDQGSCGDCFGVSAFDACSMAMVKAGVLPNDGAKGRLSSQYGLDYRDCFQGGCGGGDELQVIDYVKTHGAPLTSDYGPYTASPGRPKDVSGMNLYKIADYGYCTPSQQSGVADTEDMKKCMVAYGPLSVAFDAGECDGYRWPGTMTGHGRGVDHAVLCIGWDDNHDNGDGSKGAFLGLNQWGDWGSNGRFWIKYGADSWGTEAAWVTVATLPPPPPPVPPTPPVPPVPPTPPGPPAPGAPVTVTLTPGQVASVISQSGAVVIRGEMTLTELVDAIHLAAAQAKGRGPVTPQPCGQCPEKPADSQKVLQDIADLKRAVDALLKQALKE